MTDIQKVALITGAGTGIGRATSLAFLREGYAVVLSGRRVEPLEETVAEAGALAANALIVPTDVRNPASVRELFAKSQARFGRLDVLFNNAGIGSGRLSLEDIPYEQWQAVVETNLTGAFLCTQEAIKIMKAQTPQGGRIINNGSISAHVPRPESAPYAATKHGMTGLTRATSLEGRKYDIACGQIDIGNAASPMTARMEVGAKQADGSMKPEPVMDVANVARAVLYMASLTLDANVQFMTIMATKMPYIGRG